MTVRGRSQGEAARCNADRDPGSEHYAELVQAIHRAALGGGVKAAANALDLTDEAIYHWADGQARSPMHRTQDFLDALVAAKGQSAEGRLQALAVLVYWFRRYFGADLSAEVSLAEVNARIARLLAASGRVAAETQEAIANDKRIDEKERERLLGRVDQLDAESASVRGVLATVEVVS